MMAMRQKRLGLVCAVAVLLLMGELRWAFAGEPTDAIRSAIDRGVDVIKDVNLRDRKQRVETIERLRPIVYPVFDFREMAMRSLGAQWRVIDGQQQSEFVAVFTKLLGKTYADQIALYNGQQVAYKSEKIDGDFAEVDTQLIAKDRQRYSVLYRLHKSEGKWRIYDVVVEDISIVRNYREQFRTALNKNSFSTVLSNMKEKAN
ncbi:MAG: ABC transporter substrate-binding protein [Deltaproteobacteria bacterium]|nr:ABC transporter substrate-binding protein [Deltaproteobacteria bacterium]